MLRPICAITLALMLSFASVVLASARGNAPAVGEIVICSGFGTHAIAVDADGNPTGPAHICPDGVSAFVSVDAPVPDQPLHSMANGERLTLPTLAALVQADRLRASARGPPARA